MIYIFSFERKAAIYIVKSKCVNIVEKVNIDHNFGNLFKFLGVFHHLNRDRLTAGPIVRTCNTTSTDKPKGCLRIGAGVQEQPSAPHGLSR